MEEDMPFFVLLIMLAVLSGAFVGYGTGRTVMQNSVQEDCQQIGITRVDDVLITCGVRDPQ